MPRSGEVLLIDKKASVQFMAPMLFRLIRVHPWSTYDGWVWLDGYELNQHGDAVERRSIFVQIAGLRPVPRRAPTTTPARRSRPTAARPAMPQQRTPARTPARSTR